MMKMQWFEEHLQKEQIMELIEIWNNIILLYQPFGPASSCQFCGYIMRSALCYLPTKTCYTRTCYSIYIYIYI